jgi:hypothetical protein
MLYSREFSVLGKTCGKLPLASVKRVFSDTVDNRQ